MRNDYEALLLLARVFFISIGIGSICCGVLMFATYPILFFLALLATINGFLMLMCAARGRRYMPRERYEKEFR